MTWVSLWKVVHYNAEIVQDRVFDLIELIFLVFWRSVIFCLFLLLVVDKNCSFSGSVIGLSVSVTSQTPWQKFVGTYVRLLALLSNFITHNDMIHWRSYRGVNKELPKMLK